eukprot:CAMPEP_0167826512 /NCGR_PEP_ID=MMETSP0112_2-20121227/10077_1 /TAXON_ID=91324 /ORGANISM="Lotharella globosa, Strain CCCM811" /LENGTH=536 /DNA_ID=CAMNT_0007728967 /DNA_START=80 /DNA_END=1690 /DNA_ORIENTATION=-
MASEVSKLPRVGGRLEFVYDARKFNRDLLKATGEKRLDGYDVLRLCGVELPEDAFRAVIHSKKTIYVDVVAEHMKEFKSLMSMDLSGNRMKFPSLACFPALQELHMSCNHVSAIRIPSGPNGIAFKALMTLDLSHNVVSVDSVSELARLPELQFLDLSHNDMSKLPQLDEKSFPALKKLVLRGNRFGKVRRRDPSAVMEAYQDPESKFYKPHYDFFHMLAVLPMLRELDLSSNLIQVVPRLAPKSFMNLRLMNLSLNYVERESYLLPILSCPQLLWLDIRANLFIPVDSRRIPLAPVERLTKYDFPGICQRLVRNKRGNVIIADPDTELGDSHILSANKLDEESGPDSFRKDEYDFTAEQTPVPDPTEQLERELEKFGVEEDNTFLTTGYPTEGAKNITKINKIVLRKGRSKQDFNALKAAVAKPSAIAPDRNIAKKEGKHHLQTTGIQKIRQQPLKRPKRRCKSANSKPAIRTLEKILDTVRETQGLVTSRDSARNAALSKQLSRKDSTTSSRSSARQKQDVREIYETVRKMITI